MTDHEFVMPYPGAETIRCCNCGAGEGSPVGKQPCKPVKSLMDYRAARLNKAVHDEPGCRCLRECPSARCCQGSAPKTCIAHDHVETGPCPRCVRGGEPK